METGDKLIDARVPVPFEASLAKDQKDAVSSLSHAASAEQGNPSSIICPRCGATNAQKQFIEAFCIDCYPVDITLPKEILFDVCKRCDRIRSGREWVKQDNEEISRTVLRKCKGSFSRAYYDRNANLITFVISKGPKSISIIRRAPVTFQVTICPDCSRLSGGYYEGILQLRGDRKKVEKYARTIQRRISETSFVSRVEENRDGIDLYFGSTPAMVEVLGELQLTYRITKKLFGMKEGKTMYRSTIAVRFDIPKTSIERSDD